MVDSPNEARIAETIFALLDTRRAGGTICPSDVARTLYRSESEWRRAMPKIREVANDLAKRRLLRVTQKGEEVEATRAKGPIRLGRPKPPP